MQEEIERLKAQLDELKSNDRLKNDIIKKKNAIIEKQNEEIRNLKKEVSKLRIYQMKLGE